nr:MAG: hypothetical protein [Crogonang virus 166]
MPPRGLPQSTKWCFTLNNYTPAEYAKFASLFNPTRFKYITFGKEQGQTGTPHLQGYLVLINKARLSTLRAICPRSHWECARGTHEQAARYCQKDGEFEEFGVLPSDARGSASAFEDFVAWAVGVNEATGFCPTEREVAQAYPGLYVRYSRSLMSLIEHNCPFPSLEEGTLLPWQQEIWDFLEQPADDRTIQFVVDEEGGKGKSWFSRYMYTKNPTHTQLLSVGKRDDLAHAIDPSKRFFIFNVPRGGMEFLQYTILEQLKDRVIFSPKYNSATKILNHTPHVVVMCNEQPDIGKMTHDRYNIKEL